MSQEACLVQTSADGGADFFQDWLPEAPWSKNQVELPARGQQKDRPPFQDPGILGLRGHPLLPLLGWLAKAGNIRRVAKAGRALGLPYRYIAGRKWEAMYVS